MARNDLRQLGEIATVRKLQLAAAEAAAAKASAAVSECEGALAGSRQEIAVAVQGWETVLCANYRVDIARAWSAHLKDRDVVARIKGKELELAARLLDRRKADWRAASARQEVADEILAKTINATVVRRDEETAQSAVDRHNATRRRR